MADRCRGKGLGKPQVYDEETKKRMKQEKKDRFDVSKMTNEEKKHFEKYGKYGFCKTVDCKTCNGTGDARNGDLCEDCMCGSCTLEKYYCGGCDYYSFDELSDKE